MWSLSPGRRLKESGQQEAQRAQGLSLDLQRKEEESSDLREKLADYKKQIQQVQKEVRLTRSELGMLIEPSSHLIGSAGFSPQRSPP